MTVFLVCQIFSALVFLVCWFSCKPDLFRTKAACGDSIWHQEVLYDGGDNDWDDDKNDNDDDDDDDGFDLSAASRTNMIPSVARV